jgi:hypothetical protein
MSKHRLLSIALSVILVVWIIHFAASRLGHMDEIKGHTVPATQGPTSLVRALRPNYPYSVIPGGAYSQGELQYAHGKDTLVRSHYSDFDVKNAKLVNLTEDRFQYVSYRLKDQIYWTKRKLRIPKGELLLTDGVHYARRTRPQVRMNRIRKCCLCRPSPRKCCRKWRWPRRPRWAKFRLCR